MQLGTYVAGVRQELAAAAAAGGADARELAVRLTGPLDSAVRLALLEALSAAAHEISLDLAPGSVHVRLEGRDPAFEVTLPDDRWGDEADPDSAAAPPAPTALPAVPAVPDGEDDAMTRINLRLSEHLKGRVEAAAGRAGLSVNAWLVRAAAAALDAGDGGPAQPAGPGGPGAPAGRRGRRVPQGAEHITGWVR
jgi:hypothetical protein